MLSVSIVGGSGYVGGELLRILSGHPQCEIQQVTSQRHAKRAVTTLHPNLRGTVRLRFSPLEDLKQCDVLFLCLPHGKSSASIDQFAEKAETIVDCSADFRLSESQWHQQWYPETETAEKYRSQFVYGLPEIERDLLRNARFISGVGCNATAVNLGLYPLAKAGLIKSVISDIKAGSSEGGTSASSSSHHPERSGSVRSFAPTGHRHQAEVIQELELGRSQINFSVTAIEMIRGVLATSHVFLSKDVEKCEIGKIYREAFSDEPFIRIIRDRSGIYRYPEPKILAGTNYCDVGWKLDARNRRLVVISAIDNLVKGAAGSAVQSMNVALGFEEQAGLAFTGLHPV